MVVGGALAGVGAIGAITIVLLYTRCRSVLFRAVFFGFLQCFLSLYTFCLRDLVIVRGVLMVACGMRMWGIRMHVRHVAWLELHTFLVWCEVFLCA